MKVIQRIQIILAILFFTTTSITCTDYKTFKNSIEIVQITAATKIPIIKVNVKGQDYLFLLDSQSPVSFIDSTVVVKKKLTIETLKPQELQLVTGDMNTRSKCVTIMSNKFFIHNFKGTKDSIKWHTGLSIDGIIGNDMIYNNRASIDLKNIILDKLNKTNN